jgi:hypothetical protein
MLALITTVIYSQFVISLRFDNNFRTYSLNLVYSPGQSLLDILGQVLFIS